MKRIKTFVIKYFFKMFKTKKIVKELYNDYIYLPSEWHYIRLKDICAEMFETANIDVEVIGRDNVPAETCVFYANHQACLDPLLFFFLDKEFGFILKKELKKYEFIDKIVRITNSLYIDRENIKEGLKTITQAIENIKKGHSYIIFPEGTRTGNKLEDFHSGSFKLSTKTKTPIVPVCILNTKKALLSENSKKITVKIKILEPILYEEYKNMKTQDIAKMVKDKIQNEINAEL